MNLYNMLSGEISQQELLNHFNATITYEDMPSYINGCVFNYKNINNIMINKNLSYYLKKKTIIHELAHIELNHLNQWCSDLFAFKVSKHEDEADQYVKFLNECINDNKNTKL